MPPSSPLCQTDLSLSNHELIYAKSIAYSSDDHGTVIRDFLDEISYAAHRHWDFLCDGIRHRGDCLLFLHLGNNSMQLDLPLRGSFFYLEPLNSGTSYGCSYAFRERAGFLSFKLESRVDCEDVLYTLILRENLCNSLAWPSNVSSWPLCLDDIDSSRPAPTRALRASFDDALSK